MSFEVMKSEQDSSVARIEMRRRGIDCIDSRLARFFRKNLFGKRIEIGDLKKSWDVLNTIRLIEKYVPPDGPVLDIGAYASEVLVALHRLNYRDLTGVDFNPKISQMPHAGEIRYVVSDFMHTPFRDASFDAISAISVIEHGFQPQRLLTEVSRLLRPGGLFIASVDYWHDKIDTSEITAFGMEWIIFSKDEILTFFEEARQFGLQPCGKLDFTSGGSPVEWMGKKYTFAWLALRKV
jgi:SAM-dependent methyltransferase